jgi:hypothetical protein
MIGHTPYSNEVRDYDSVASALAAPSYARCTHRDKGKSNPFGAALSEQCTHEALPGIGHCFYHVTENEKPYRELILKRQGSGSSQPKTYDEIKKLEKDRERARREVKRELDEEEALTSRVAMPEGISLADLLARPVEEIPYRIKGVLPRDGRAILAAPMKAGKTTLMGNLIRSLVDGDPFLGQYEVEPITGRVVLFDFEMPEILIQEWLREQGIRNVDRVHLFSMRGRGEAFDIRNSTIRGEWAEKLRQLDAEVIIGDPIKAVLDSLGLSEHVEAGKLLTPFDALLAESGAKEAVWAHHMGHNGERSRGDSTLRGWPDVEWKILTDIDKETGERKPGTPAYFWAFGRDVDVRESELSYDHETRRLSIAGDPLTPRNRKSSRRESLREAIVRQITENPGVTTGDLAKAVDMHNRETSILRDLVDQDVIHTVKKGPAKLYFPGAAPVAEGDES